MFFWSGFVKLAVIKNNYKPVCHLYFIVFPRGSRCWIKDVSRIVLFKQRISKSGLNVTHLIFCSLSPKIPFDSWQHFDSTNVGIILQLKHVHQRKFSRRLESRSSLLVDESLSLPSSEKFIFSNSALEYSGSLEYPSKLTNSSSELSQINSSSEDEQLPLWSHFNNKHCYSHIWRQINY